MATSPSLPPSGLPPTGSPSPGSPPGPNAYPSTSDPPTSLYLYTFVATVSLLFIILSTLVARSVRRRRRHLRNAAILPSIADVGSYPSANAPRGGCDYGPIAPKPVLREAYISSRPGMISAEKVWGETVPIAGATLLPVTKLPIRDVTSHHLSWRSRLHVPYFTARHSAEPVPPSPAPSLELVPISQPASFKPIHLAVLVSMPMPPAHWKVAHGTGGPPVVELGVTNVECAQFAVKRSYGYQA